MFVVAGCSGPLPNAVPLPLARSSPPVSHHLLHLPEIQSGMENPHPQPIYTSCLTSPVPLVVCFFIPSGGYLYLETVVEYEDWRNTPVGASPLFSFSRFHSSRHIASY